MWVLTHKGSNLDMCIYAEFHWFNFPLDRPVCLLSKVTALIISSVESAMVE